MTTRTRQALLEGLRERTKAILDTSIENEKEANDFLQGVRLLLKGIGKRQDQMQGLREEEIPRQGIHHPSARRCYRVASARWV